MTATLQINWIRHFPVENKGRYIGHTDIPAIIPEEPVNTTTILPETALWFASPLRRAVASANYLRKNAHRNSQPLQIAPELMEQNFGAWENKTYDEVWNNEKTLHNWQNPAFIKPQGGENFAELCARVDGWLENILKGKYGTPLIVIAHSGVVRAGLRHSLKITPEQALNFTIDYGSITQVEYFSGGSGARVNCVNNT